MLNFAISVGSGDFYPKSRYLIRSIESAVNQKYRLIAFLPKFDADNLSKSQREYFEEKTDLFVGELPIDNYPISSKLAALRKAEESKASWYILLDTDTIVLRDFEFLGEYVSKDVDVIACPEHGGWTYWAGRKSQADWEAIYDRFNLEFPGYVEKSMMDNSPMPPYWNAGVVISNGNLGREWISLTKRIHNWFVDHSYYADQVALAVLSQKLTLRKLPYEYNYPIYMHLSCPSTCGVLHYDSLKHLGRIFNPKIRTKLAELGIYDSPDVPTGIGRIHATTHGVAVRVYREFARKQKSRMFEFIRRLKSVHTS